MPWNGRNNNFMKQNQEEHNYSSNKDLKPFQQKNRKN